MNLYRSFGNLMEAWVTEEDQASYSELLGSNDERSPSPPTNLRSESVDSGVEMASPDMSFHATCSAVSTHTTELEGFTPDRGGSTRAPGSSVPSCPSPSNPVSPCLPPSGAPHHPSISHRKVEAALQRSSSKHLQDRSGCLTATEIRRRDSGLHQRPASQSLRGQRSGRFDLRRMFNPSEPLRLTRHRWSSVASDTLAFQRNLEELREDEAKGLSPGLCYLEQVCQMLEEFAQQQRHSQAWQRQRSDLQTHLEAEPAVEALQASDSCLTGSGAAGTSPLQESRGMEDAASRGQHLSTDDLLMELTPDLEKQGTDVEKRASVTRSWKTKIASFARNGSVMRETKSQQMQPTEKKQARLRLRQLFRRSKKKTV